MKNGDTFLAYQENVRLLIDGIRSLDYYQEPMPSNTDRELDHIINRFMALQPEQRRAFTRNLPHPNRSLFGIYGHRAATRALRQADTDLLLWGLVGSTIANASSPDERQLGIRWAVYHHCAAELSQDPNILFSKAAEYAGPELALSLIIFGKRKDVELKKFGWRKLPTTDGIMFKFFLS